MKILILYQFTRENFSWQENKFTELVCSPNLETSIISNLNGQSFLSLLLSYPNLIATPIVT